MIYDSILECIGRTPVVRLNRLFPTGGVEVLAKLEFLNPGGSIKDRPAKHIIEQGLRSGAITGRSRLVESTSGNFGIALAMVAKIYNLTFTAVIDPNISPANLAILRNLGACIDLVTAEDAAGGYLHSRISRVAEIVAGDPDAFWINQYANELNQAAHYSHTAEELIDDLETAPDVLVVAVSTGGTIVGTARRMRIEYPGLIVIGVDSVGSVIFGGPPGTRRLPGIGASRRPELIDLGVIDRVVHVTEPDCIAACHDLLTQEGILAGASSGAVIAAVRGLLPLLPERSRVVTLFPDRGERYLDLVFPAAEQLDIQKRGEER
ncbi:2,3-diaminopropionate biosynthesis protein SbnA [Salinispora pacifica]|uniref:2,3-diaminopropionate biosynthesis protein SbnA n=1 Tax=Salinispora pacifica TaxID=351187 RepID=UPI00036C0EF7|nr:2,3-diaminopropionate biosynthesis protein SbnA [Salinispora pacifica]